MTPFDLLQRLAGEIRELAGAEHHPAIQWGHMLCGLGSNQPDETPWCSAIVNLVFYLHRKARSKSAAARSWLTVGEVVSDIGQAQKGDVVILKRGTGAQPGADVIKAPGHVGLFAGHDRMKGIVFVLGGNQSDQITVASFPEANVLGIRRIV